MHSLFIGISFLYIWQPRRCTRRHVHQQILALAHAVKAAVGCASRLTFCDHRRSAWCNISALSRGFSPSFSCVFSFLFFLVFSFLVGFASHVAAIDMSLDLRSGKRSFVSCSSRCSCSRVLLLSLVSFFCATKCCYHPKHSLKHIHTPLAHTNVHSPGIFPAASVTNASRDCSAACSGPQPAHMAAFSTDALNEAALCEEFPRRQSAWAVFALGFGAPNAAGVCAAASP